jgi:hypothetical protein
LQRLHDKARPLGPRSLSIRMAAAACVGKRPEEELLDELEG